MKFNKLISTSGSGTGMWFSKAAQVKCTNIVLGYTDPDPGFMVSLRKALDELGFKGRDVSYSEHGMQSDNYVSCDVGKSFIKSWRKLCNEK